jgi:hypothetical protein
VGDEAHEQRRYRGDAMASGTSTAAPPAAIPRDATASAARRAAPAAVTVIAVAVVLKLVYGPWFLNYDARYALLWARDLWRGHKPEYLADFAPTPHPLETALSSLALPFGDHADTLITWVTLLLFGACVWLVYRLGETLFGRWVGVVAAAAVLTRPALERDAVLAYQDAGFAALVLGALLAEARRPRTGYRAPVLLALAGLLRPEAWLLSGVNLIWNWRASDARRRATLLVIAAAAPVLWAVTDALVTGDPLHSLHGTAHLAVANGRRRHVWQVPYWTAQYFGFILRQPLVAAIPLGLLFAWVYRLKRALLPLAAAATLTAVFVAGPVFGLPLIGRYVRTPAELLCLFYGLAVAGFTLLPHGRARRRWQVAGMVALACSVVYLPWHVALLRDLHRFTARDAKLYGDLQHFARLPATRAAFAACGPLAATDHRPIPYLRYWLGGDPGSVGTIERHLSPLGKLLVVPRRSKIAKGFYGPAFPRTRPPAGWRVVAADRSYRLYAAPGCVTAPPS